MKLFYNKKLNFKKRKEFFEMTKQELEQKKRQIEREIKELELKRIQNQQIHKDLNVFQNLNANKLYYFFWITVISTLGIPISAYTYFTVNNMHILTLIIAMSVLDILNIADIIITQKNIDKNYFDFQKLSSKELIKLENDLKEAEKSLEKSIENQENLKKETEKDLILVDGFNQFIKEKINYADIHFSNDLESSIVNSTLKQLRKVK